MEKLKAKHDHKLTDILKVAIFGIFLILPFMVYAPNALYYGVNKYAVAQEKTEQVPIYYDSNEVTQVSDLYIGNIYRWEDNVTSPYNSYKQFFTIYPNESMSFVSNIENADYGVFRTDAQGNIRLEIYYIGGGSNTYSVSSRPYDFVIKALLADINDITPILDHITETYNTNIVKEYVEETTTMSIAESMNTAWEQTWETPMFNWTSQSVLKQGLDNFTGVFGVSDTSYFTNLIVYELIMVAIYIVIDIVITMFKWLTHLFGER